MTQTLYLNERAGSGGCPPVPLLPVSYPEGELSSTTARLLDTLHMLGALHMLRLKAGDRRLVGWRWPEKPWRARMVG